MTEKRKRSVDQRDEQRKALQPRLDELLRLYREPRTTDLGWWHAVGVCVNDLLPSDRREYGLSIESIADKLKPGRDRNTKKLTVFLYRFRDFAMKFRKTDVRKLEARIRAGQISADHVTYLLSVNRSNSKTRQTFLDEAAKNGWSANRLRRAIQDDKRQGLSKCGGRRPQPRTTTNPAIAARDIVVQARRWSTCHDQYFGNSGLLKKLPKSNSPLLLRELEAALAGLREVAKQAAEARNILKPIVEKMRTAVTSVSSRKTIPRRSRMVGNV